MTKGELLEKSRRILDHLHCKQLELIDEVAESHSEIEFLEMTLESLKRLKEGNARVWVGQRDSGSVVRVSGSCQNPPKTQSSRKMNYPPLSPTCKFKAVSVAKLQPRSTAAGDGGRLKVSSRLKALSTASGAHKRTRSCKSDDSDFLRQRVYGRIVKRALSRVGSFKGVEFRSFGGRKLSLHNQQEGSSLLKSKAAGTTDGEDEGSRLRRGARKRTNSLRKPLSSRRGLDNRSQVTLDTSLETGQNHAKQLSRTPLKVPRLVGGFSPTLRKFEKFFKKKKFFCKKKANLEEGATLREREDKNSCVGVDLCPTAQSRTPVKPGSSIYCNGSDIGKQGSMSGAKPRKRRRKRVNDENRSYRRIEIDLRRKKRKKSNLMNFKKTLKLSDLGDQNRPKKHRSASKSKNKYSYLQKIKIKTPKLVPRNPNTSDFDNLDKLVKMIRTAESKANNARNAVFESQIPGNPNFGDIRFDFTDESNFGSWLEKDKLQEFKTILDECSETPIQEKKQPVSYVGLFVKSRLRG